jgi:hypothetical protein
VLGVSEPPGRREADIGGVGQQQTRHCCCRTGKTGRVPGRLRGDLIARGSAARAATPRAERSPYGTSSWLPRESSSRLAERGAPEMIHAGPASAGAARRRVDVASKFGVPSAASAASALGRGVVVAAVLRRRRRYPKLAALPTPTGSRRAQWERLQLSGFDSPPLCSKSHRGPTSRGEDSARLQAKIEHQHKHGIRRRRREAKSPMCLPVAVTDAVSALTRSALQPSAAADSAVYCAFLNMCTSLQRWLLSKSSKLLLGRARAGPLSARSHCQHDVLPSGDFRPASAASH